MTQDITYPTAVWRPMEAQLMRLDNAKTPTERRAAIVLLEGSMLGQAQTECPLRHHFSPGLYGREIFMPAGTCVVGKIHRHAHINTVSKGRCLVYTEHGTELLEAGDTFISQPGTKRAVFVIEDTLWTTTHANPTNSQDIPWLEDQIIAPSFDALAHDKPLEVTA